MSSATIRLFLPHGDAKRLRTAEISNWTGKAVAAPRTEFEDLLRREELEKSGIYILSGTDPDSNSPRAYIGEAEVIRDRLKQHKSKDFWVSAIVFISKDENLTKAHIRYLEGRLLAEAKQVGRFQLENGQSSSSRLPESDREDMEVFLSHIRTLMPVLGSDILIKIAAPAAKPLICRVKNALARGQRTADGFVVFKGSTAVIQERPACQSYLSNLRKKLVSDGVLVERDGVYVFTKDTEFPSPSGAASVIHGGGVNGLTEWREPSLQQPTEA